MRRACTKSSKNQIWGTERVSEQLRLKILWWMDGGRKTFKLDQ